MSFEGDIGEIDLVQRLVELGREKFTGALRFEQDGIIKIVYFKNGDVLSASTNDRSDAVDEILLRAGKVSKEHVKQALATRKENETLGDALLNLGFITRKELTWGRRIQVIGILRSVRAWATGSYAIVADYLPKREEGTLFPLPQILIELFVTEHERQPFERALDGGSAVLTKVADFDAEFQRLGLNEEAGEIAAKIDGERTAAEIAGVAGKDVFNTYKLLEGLRALGLLHKAEVKDELGFESAGVADASEAWSSSSGSMEDFHAEPEPPVQSMGEQAPVAAAAVPEPSNTGLTWGFDEAQIETAERATTPPPPEPTPSEPPPPPPAARASLSSTYSQSRRTPQTFARPKPKKGTRFPVFGLIVLLIIAAAGYGGWYWWTSRRAAAVPVAARPATHPIVPAPPVTGSAAINGGVAEAGIPERRVTAIAAPVGRPMVPAPTPRKEPSRRELKPVAVPKPTAPAAIPSQERYAALAAQYARNPQGNFTVQFELVCQEVSLGKALEGGGANVWFVPISYRGKSCYRVFWGHYPTHEAADAAVNQIPAALRGGKPVVVAVPTP